MLRRWIVLAAPLALAACQKTETPDQAQTRMQTESDAAKAAISTVATQYGVHLTANHPDSLAEYFTDNGIIMPPGAPAVTGKAAIRTWLAANGLPPGATITIQTVDVTANGPLAVERGTYAFSMPAQGRTPAMNNAGKYLNHWHRVNDKWLIAAQIWSDDVPMPPMPPAPARHN